MTSASPSGAAGDILRGTLDLLILKALSLQPMHGWAIAQRLEQLSGQRKYPTIEFEDGTTYREESADMAARIRAGELSSEAGGSTAA